MPKPDARWTLAYGLSVAAFAVAEALAIRSAIPGRTFSSQVRWSQSLLPTQLQRIAKASIVTTAVVLGAHLATGVERRISQ